MSAALVVEVGCPLCEGAVEMLAPGRPDICRTNAICRCTECDVDIQIVVQLAVTRNPNYRGGTHRRKANT